MNSVLTHTHTQTHTNWMTLLVLWKGREGRELRKQETPPPPLTLSTFSGSHPYSSSLQHPLSHHSLLTRGRWFGQVVTVFRNITEGSLIGVYLKWKVFVLFFGGCASAFFFTFFFWNHHFLSWAVLCNHNHYATPVQLSTPQANIYTQTHTHPHRQTHTHTLDP